MDFADFDALTFDCYGTLIDWETGLLAALRPVVGGVRRRELLERFARHEARLEAGPYLRYADVLAGCLRGLGDELGFAPPRMRSRRSRARSSTGRRSQTARRRWRG